MKKILFLALAALATLQAAAQWRIGVNVGGMYNHYVIDKHYFDDYQYKDRWGVGFGLMGQHVRGQSPDILIRNKSCSNHQNALGEIDLAHRQQEHDKQSREKCGYAEPLPS